MPNQIRRTRGFTLLELMVTVAIISILSAIAIPNFMKFQARSKQSEAVSNLKVLYIAEQAYYQAKSTYTSHVATLGFNPDRGNRYEYALNAGSQVFDSRTTTLASTPANADSIMVDAFKFPNETAQPAATLKCGTNPTVVTGSTGSFLAAALGNVDSDATLDQWSIASYTRTTLNCDADTNVVGGEPVNEQDDVIEP